MIRFIGLKVDDGNTSWYWKADGRTSCRVKKNCNSYRSGWKEKVGRQKIMKETADKRVGGEEEKFKFVGKKRKRTETRRQEKSRVKKRIANIARGVMVDIWICYAWLDNQIIRGGDWGKRCCAVRDSELKGKKRVRTNKDLFVCVWCSSSFQQMRTLK